MIAEALLRSCQPAGFFMVIIGINAMKQKRQQAAKITVSGTVTKSPQRVKTATGKVMAIMTIQTESEHRSPYPLTLVAYDDDALTLMTCQKGNRIAATGWPRWYNGYQLSGAVVSK